MLPEAGGNQELKRVELVLQKISAYRSSYPATNPHVLFFEPGASAVQKLIGHSDAQDAHRSVGDQLTDPIVEVHFSNVQKATFNATPYPTTLRCVCESKELLGRVNVDLVLNQS